MLHRVRALPVLNTDAVRAELGIGHDLHVFASIIAGTLRGQVMPTPRRTAVVAGGCAENEGAVGAFVSTAAA